ncbi:NADH dehydrogenase [ubiquinone] 1 alpha subcomplex subunit 13 [Thrips palmi]|uniref:NADH dehydrogenase [ubiquinone] 1 alpha subcomplex subunit 13 n=1 Tax=Thrips palmi TaxID=161013 RepID=A0A6P9AHP4_THRPL|nr:NADH dehydrogenase [ubiquinone] 1 alpha subcomplex subunit 13 [Thrips palmi]
MSSVARLQDLPPPGGFGKIHYEKVPHKSFFNGKWIAITFGISYALGIAGYLASVNIIKRQRIETQSARNAIQPFLLAERDRQLLLQMRKNRDAEAELMKDVEGWEVGTLFGTPVYNTVGENEWIGYRPNSYYAHADPDRRLDYEGFSLYV